MTKFASFDSSGLPVAFYSEELHGDGIPDEAVEISDAAWLEFINNSGLRRWDGERVVEYTPPPPIPTADDYRREIQNLIDTKAQEKDYDSGATLASYVSSTIPQWAAEASAFVAWRDAVWLYTLTELDKVQNQQRTKPTIDAFLVELPTMVWPVEN